MNTGAAGRPAKVSALHDSLDAANALFGVSFELETPLYFAAPGELAVETPSQRRSNAFQAVREECMES
jgi:dimethylglycine dehydrogenase